LVGDVRVEVRPVGDEPVFVGVAPAAAADRYLQGVSHIEVDNFDNAPVERAGAGVLSPPGDSAFWAVSASGTGPQAVTWSAAPGGRVVGVASADGAAGATATVEVGAAVPALPLVAVGLLVRRAVLLVIGGALVAVAINRATAPQETSSA